MAEGIMDTAETHEEEPVTIQNTAEVHEEESVSVEPVLKSIDGDLLMETNDALLIADKSVEQHHETKNWLDQHGLSSIVNNCLQNDITIDALMEADANDIRIMCTEANIKTQHRLKMQSALRTTANSLLSFQKTPEPNTPYLNEINTETQETNPKEQTNEVKEETIKAVDSKRESDFKFKVLLVGDSAVGKSCILTRFRQDTFVPTFVSTIGVDFVGKSIEINDKIVKLILWDTAGQERFRSITVSYYRGAHAVCIVYDVTERETFEHVQQWVNNVKEMAMDDISIFVVGSKRDLVNRRKVTFEEGQKLANLNECKFCEVSAKSGRNIPTLFNAIALHLMETQPKIDRNYEEKLKSGKSSKGSQKKSKKSKKPKKMKQKKSDSDKNVKNSDSDKNIKLHAKNHKKKKPRKWC